MPEVREHLAAYFRFYNDRGLTRCREIGRGLKSMMGRGRCWRLIRRPWFVMGRVELIRP
jgi:hypothetical protein